MVQFAIDMAESTGMKAIRLDVIRGNLPAETLYPNLGFIYIDTLAVFYDRIGRLEFELYERPIIAPGQIKNKV